MTKHARDKLIAVFFCICLAILSAGTMGRLLKSAKNGELKKEDARATISAVEEKANDVFLYKNKWINLNGLFQKCIGKTADLDKDWYRLENGQLIYSLNKVDDNVLDSYADNVIQLNDWCSENGIKLIYVKLPFKAAPEDYPAGSTQYGNANTHRLTSRLAENGVTVLDLDERIASEGLVREDMYFDTDHHWTPRAALWGAGEISRFLADHGAWTHDPELFDINNYDIESYDDWFLGSIGKKIGNVYAGVDDFEVITPKFETSYTFYAETASGETRREGTFRDVMIVERNLKKDYFNVNTYAAYIGGDYKYNEIRNEAGVNGSKILLLRDSFSCTLLPFLSTASQDITAVDLRYFDRMTVKEYLEQYRPDYLIIAYNPSSVAAGQFTFE